MSSSFHILTWIFVFLFMLWLSRARLRPRPRSERDILTYPRPLFILGILYILTFLGFAALMLTTPKSKEKWSLSLFFVAMSLWGLPLITAYLFERHRVSAQGIEYGPLFGIGSGGYLPWSEVRRVKFSRFMRWFIVEGHDGTKVRVSVMMMGLPEFARYLLAAVAPEVMDAKTLYLLRQTAAGLPPDLGM